MKTFAQYLTEAPMSVQDALKVFGLSTVPDEKALDKKYKELAIANHPDRGGDVVKMQQINLAHEVLEQQVGNIVQTQTRDEKRKVDAARAQAIYDSVLGTLKSHYNDSAFISYFNEVFSDTFTSKVEEKFYSSLGYSLSQSFEYTNASRTTVIYFSISIDLVKLVYGRSPSIGVDDKDLQMNISTSILHNNRKVKISQQDYTSAQTYAILKDPEIIFPKNKLVSKMDQSGRKFAKRDAHLLLTKTLMATYQDGGYYYIPLFEDFKLLIYRSTSMGLAFYGINGIYQKSRRVYVPKGFVSIYETEKSFSILVDGIKAMTQLRDLPSLQTALEQLISYYDKVRRNGEA